MFNLDDRVKYIGDYYEGLGRNVARVVEKREGEEEYPYLIRFEFSRQTYPVRETELIYAGEDS